MCSIIKSVFSKIAGFLRIISIGKYDQGLYLNERRHQSSVCGGLFTIALTTVILSYMVAVFYTIMQREQYTVNESSVLFDQSGILEATVNDIHSQLPKMIRVDIITEFSEARSCDDLRFFVTHDEVSQTIQIQSEQVSRISIQCNYNMDSSLEFKTFLTRVGNRRIVNRGVPTAGSRLSYNLFAPNDNYRGINMFMFYKRNMITQQKGLEQSDTQVLLLQNLTNMPDLVMDFVKYQTTDDIIGFSLTGPRSESDYETTYALHDTIVVRERGRQNLLDSIDPETFFDSDFRIQRQLEEQTDQNHPELQQNRGRAIRFQFDSRSRMAWYTRFPTQTVIQGLSRTGGLVAILNIVGIFTLMAHQVLFENRLRRLDQKFLAEQQEQLKQQLEATASSKHVRLQDHNPTTPSEGHEDFNLRGNQIQNLTSIDQDSHSQTVIYGAHPDQQVDFEQNKSLKGSMINAVPEHLTTSTNVLRATNGQKKTSFMGRNAQNNQFRSMYSFQTFKWLILQTQAHAIQVDDLVNRVQFLEYQLSKLQNQNDSNSNFNELEQNAATELKNLQARIQNLEMSLANKQGVTQESLNMALQTQYMTFMNDFNHRLHTEAFRQQEELRLANLRREADKIEVNQAINQLKEQVDKLQMKDL